MSANPRVVLTDVYVTSDRCGTLPLFVRHGTVVDIVPGSALETAYGGAGNLSPAAPPWSPQRFSDTSWPKAAISN